jgi:hypothetical protein
MDHQSASIDDDGPLGQMTMLQQQMKEQPPIANDSML